MSSHVKYLAAVERTATPWKNGGGLTREITRDAGAADAFEFRWRLSVAEVGQEGPFSCFPGCRRVLVLLDGTHLTLRFRDGEVAQLRPFDVYEFDGEREVSAELPNGPVRDLNLIYRPESVSVALRFTKPAETWTVPTDETLVLVNTEAQPVWCATAEAWRKLAPLDAVRAEGNAFLSWHGGFRGAVARVSLKP